MCGAKDNSFGIDQSYQSESLKFSKSFEIMYMVKLVSKEPLKREEHLITRKKYGLGENEKQKDNLDAFNSKSQLSLPLIRIKLVKRNI
jgi:hypothetical protein